MGDTYQAVYDAVRSRISNADIGHAVESAIQTANLSFFADQARDAVYQAACAHQRPSVLYRPALSADGDMWCALLGDNLQEGIAGFGRTPSEAMEAFDQAFLTERTPTARRLEKDQAHA